MSRIVIDADGLIKLGKSGALDVLLRVHEVLVPAVVYQEAVVAGKKALHEDASRLEEALEGYRACYREDRESPEVANREEISASLGSGERAAFDLYTAEEADAILSDDRTFANFLARIGIPVFASADAIVALAESNELRTDEGEEFLERLRPHIREEVFESALQSVRSVPSHRKDEAEERKDDDR